MQIPKIKTLKLALLVLVVEAVASSVVAPLVDGERQLIVRMANATPLSLTGSMTFLRVFAAVFPPLVVGLVVLLFAKDSKLRTIFGAFSLYIIGMFISLIYAAKCGDSSMLIAYPIWCALVVLKPFVGVYLAANIDRLIKREVSFLTKAFLYGVYVIALGFVL